MEESKHIGQYILTYDMKEEMINELNLIKNFNPKLNIVVEQRIATLSNILIELISRIE